MEILSYILIVVLAHLTLKYKNRSERDLFTNSYHKQWFLGNGVKGNRLTGLMRRAKKNIKSSFGILFIDLDRFKEINDTQGHKVGDDILCQVVGILKRSTRQSPFSRIPVCEKGKSIENVVLIVKSIYWRIKTSGFKPYDWVIRFGGDEFIVVVRGIECEKDLNKIADRIIGRLRGTNKITASIGGTFFKVREDEVNEEIFMKRVDGAVYESKDKGRDRYTVV